MSNLKKDINIEFDQIALLIEEARNRAFHKVNEELVLLYFKVGSIVSNKVSEGIWGDKTVHDLAAYIDSKYPGINGFNRRGLYRMKQFYETYSAFEFVTPLVTHLETYFIGSEDFTKVSAVPTQVSGYKQDLNNMSAVPTQMNKLNNLQQKFISSVLTKISWSNHLEILSQTKSPEEKFFYLMNCIKEKWSMRELRRQLSTGYFERAMISDKKKPRLLKQLPQNLFKDPYIFEFLDIPDSHSEKDLEKAIILNLQKFIIEIGKGFTYMGNQFRIQVGNKDYYTDLLFYHRDLQCLVLFELKIQEFEPEFLGKINFYLEALDRDVKRPHENPSIGIILCKGKDTEVVEYAMARNISPAMVADYETRLIDKKILANKLHQLVEQLSKENFE